MKFDLRKYQLANLSKTARMSIAFEIFLFSFFITFITCNKSSAAWEWQSPKPQGNTLNAVFFVDNSTGYAVGSFNTIMKTTDGGISWATQTSNNTSPGLYDIQCPVDSLTCYATGSNGKIVKTTDGGSNWILLSTGTANTLNAIDCPVDVNTCYAVGDSGKIIVTNNGGGSWVAQTSGITSTLRDITCPVDATTCFAVGDSGQILKTTNSGSSWTIVGTGGINLKTISCPVDNMTCIISASSSQSLKTIDGGVTWNNVGTSSRWSILCPHDTNTCYSGGYGNTVEKTVDGGTTWNVVYMKGGYTINSISCPIDNSTCFIGGTYGLMAKTANGGTNWTDFTTGVTNFNVNYSIDCPLDTKTCYAAGSSGTANEVYKTTDGGTNWSAQSIGSSMSLRVIQCPVDETTCYAVAYQKVIKTSNGGANWSVILSKPSIEMRALNCPLNSKICYAGGVSGTMVKTVNGGMSWVDQNVGTDDINSMICPGNTDTCYAVGSAGVIRKTTNGGNDWLAQTSGITDGLTGISCTADSLTCLAVGSNGKILKTTNGGSNWVSMTSGTTANLGEIKCNTDLSECVISGWATILASNDFGATWSPETHYSSSSLYGVECSNDMNTCYAGGSWSTILKKGFDIFDPANPSITNNQTGDDAIRIANDGTYDVDFTDSGGAHISQFQVRACSTNSNCGDIYDWTIVKKYIDLDVYTTNWELPDILWNALPNGTSYISARVFDGAGNMAELGPLFYVKKDTTPPIQSAWSPSKGATIATNSPTITFTTDENADCKWSLTDDAYSAMVGDCTGDGTTSQSCATSGLSEGAEIVYIACRDTVLNADTASSNTHVDYMVDTAFTGDTNSWITIPAGDFVMGCAAADGMCEIDGREQPKHTVTLSEYNIQKYEVTNAQYAACVAASVCTAPSSVNSATHSPYYGNATYDNYPVTNVDWTQANTYCGWIGGRLPTEAEWEKAARGSSPREPIFPWGDGSPTCALANLYDGSVYCVGDTTTVGAYPLGVSYYGARDIAGNLWEWVNDWFDISYYSVSPTTNPQGPGSSPDGKRVVKGGSFSNPASFRRISTRFGDTPATPMLGNTLGFRCAHGAGDLTPPSQSSWSPTKSSTIKNTTLTIRFTTDETADCKWALADLSYSSMVNDCTGDGTVSQRCDVSGLSSGANTVYTACRDTLGNEDSIATNEHIDYTANLPAGTPPAPPGSNVNLISNLAGGNPQNVFVQGNYAYVAAYSFLSIIDISAPANPVRVSYFDTQGVANGVYVSGNYAYVADDYAGLRIIDISNPAAPAEVGSFNTPGNSKDVFVSGSYAYVADASSGLRIINISDPSAPSESGFVDTSGYSSGVYVSGTYAYVADETYGLRVIDVSNPSAPVEVGFYDTSRYAKDVFVSGNYAYIADYDDGMRVIDISNPTAPAEAGFYDTSGEAYGVYVSGNYAYVADYNGFRVINVSNPAAPAQTGTLITQGRSRGVIVTGNYAYVADETTDGGGGSAGLSVINISNPAAPGLTGELRPPADAFTIQVSGDYAYMVDQMPRNLDVIDISLLSSPVLVESQSNGLGIADVKLSGNYAFTTCKFAKYINVFNISNPLNLTSISTTYTAPAIPNGIFVNGNYIYVADNTSGLRVVNASNPAALSETGYYDTPGSATDVSVSGNYAYVADGASGLRVVDVSNPAAPAEVGFYDTPGNANGVFVSGNYAYVADAASGLRIINVSTPSAPAEVGFLDTPGSAMKVFVSGRLAYVADSSGLRVIDVSTPSAPAEVGYYDTPGTARGIYVADNKAFVADGESGLWILGYAGLESTHPSVVDNQMGDDTYHSINPGTIYDVDISDTGGSHLNKFQIRACSTNANCGDVIGWTDVVTGLSPADSYSTDWALPATVWNALQQGTNYISIRVYDGDNNITADGPLFYVKKDVTPPGVSFILPADGSLQESTFLFSASDNDSASDLNTCEYMVESYDGSSWVQTHAWSVRTCGSATGTISVGSASDCRNQGLGTGSGACRVSLRATDKAGNVQTLAPRYFIISFWETKTSSSTAAIACPLNEKVCYAVGSSGSIKKTTDGGNTWTSQTSGTTLSLVTIHCPVDEQTCYAGGGDWSNIVILKTTDGGSAWNTVYASSGSIIYTIHCPLDADTCFAVDNLNSVLKTTNGGASWTALSSGASNGLYAAYCPDEETCYGTGWGGVIRKTTDGGANWAGLTSGTSNHLHHVSCPIDANTCYAVGMNGTIRKTTNAGTTWIGQSSSGFSNWIRTVQCPGLNTCYAVGDSGVRKTIDGGTNWVAEPSNVVSDVDCPVDINTCYIAGNTSIQKKGYGYSETTAPAIVNNQAGDNTWRGSNSGTYNVDFSDTGGSHLNMFQIRACSTNTNCGDSKGWTIVKRVIAADTFSTDWPLPNCVWNSLPNGVSYISIRVYDGAGNKTEQGPVFYVKKDLTIPVFSGISNISSCAGGCLQAEWSAASDSGGATPITYNLYVSTASGSQNFTTPSYATTGTSFQISGLNFNQFYYIVVRAKDAAGNEDSNVIQKNMQVPAASSPIVIDNQTGDDTWHTTDPGAIYNVDFSDTGGSNLNNVQYTVYSAAGMTGTQRIAWTDIATGINAASYTSNWGVNFSALATGTNYVSVRAYDNGGNVSAVATDVFYVNKGSFDINVPLCTSTPVIDGVINVAEWSGAYSNTLTLTKSSGGTRNSNWKFCFDGTYFYVGVQTGMASGWDSMIALLTDGNNDGHMTGNVGASPHQDFRLGLASTGGWSGYGNFTVYTNDSFGGTNISLPSGFSRATAGTSNVAYEFRVPIGELNVSSNRFALEMVLRESVADGDYSYPPSGVPLSSFAHFTFPEFVSPTITDNQIGDDTWRTANPGAIYDVDFSDTGGSDLNNVQYTVYSAAGMSGTQVKSWTDIATGINNSAFTSNWGIDFSSLSPGKNYISVKAYDNAGNVSAVATDAFYVRFDPTPPTGNATVNDGTGTDVDTWVLANSLSANWSAAADSESGVLRYWYAIGTTAGATNTVGWTDNATATIFTKTGLSLVNGQTYYASVKAENSAGLFSAPVTSDGALITLGTLSSTITTPANGSAWSALSTISGTATETTGFGLNRVEVSIKRMIDGKYWSGSAWGASQSWLTASGTSSWTLSAGLPAWVDGQQYEFQSRAANNVPMTETPSAGNIATYDNSKPSTVSSLNDGTDMDVTFSADSTQISANWNAASDVHSGIALYRYAIGTSPGAADTVNWTDNGAPTSLSRNGLSLDDGSTYYVSVKAVNGAGLESTVVVSNGVTVDVSAPVVSFLSPASEANLEGDTIVTGTVSDTSLTSWSLYYGPGQSPSVWKQISSGATGLQNAELGTWSSASLSGTYTLKLSASDAFSRTSEATRTVTVNNVATMSGTLPGGVWKLLGMSVVPNATSTIDIYGNGEYKIYRWDPDAPDLPNTHQYRYPPTLTRGMSYWIKSYGGDMPFNFNGGITDTTSSIEIQVKEGWNMIASPFNRNFNLSQIQVKDGSHLMTYAEAVAQGLIPSKMLRYDNNSWVQVTPAEDLTPGTGYEMRAYKGLILVFDPGAGMSGGLARVVRNEIGFTLNIEASTEDLADKFNLIGTMSKASNTFDGDDMPEPNVLPDGPYLSLYFPHDDWQSNPGRYADDIRALNKTDGSSESWPFNVETSETGQTVTLQWDNTALPIDKYTFTLVNLDTGERINMAERNTYTYTATGSDVSQSHFKIEVVKLAVTLVTKTHTLQPGWNLISVPVEPELTSALAQLGDDLPMLNVYQFFDGKFYDAASADIQAGLGYWVYVADNSQIDIVGLPVANGKSVTVPLKPGWNIIGNPFETNLNWNDDDIALTCAGADLRLSQATSSNRLQAKLFEFNGTDYIEASAMEPWKGYFVKAFEKCDLVLKP